MKQQNIIFALGVIQIILLTLFGLYFYRLTQRSTPTIPAQDTQVQLQTVIPELENQRTPNFEKRSLE